MMSHGPPLVSRSAGRLSVAMHSQVASRVRTVSGPVLDIPPPRVLRDDQGMSEYEFQDPLGSRLAVEALTSRTAVVQITQDDKGPAVTAEVIVTPAEIQAVADAVRKACA